MYVFFKNEEIGFRVENKRLTVIGKGILTSSGQHYVLLTKKKIP